MDGWHRLPDGEEVLVIGASLGRHVKGALGLPVIIAPDDWEHLQRWRYTRLMIVSGQVKASDAPRIDPFDRTLRRHFVIRSEHSERFDQGGRLFGGFWLALKADRRKNIRINGEPVADLDFGTMFTRLAYARLGLEPPRGDLYAIAGAEGYRSGIKMAMNTFLFDTHMRRSKWPSELGVGVGSDKQAKDGDSTASEFKARLPAGWTVGRTRKAVLELHPALQKAWGRGLGYELMFDESRILLLALTRLMGKNKHMSHRLLKPLRDKLTRLKDAMLVLHHTHENAHR